MSKLATKLAQQLHHTLRKNHHQGLVVSTTLSATSSGCKRSIFTNTKSGALHNHHHHQQQSSTIIVSTTAVQKQCFSRKQHQQHQQQQEEHKQHESFSSSTTTTHFNIPKSLLALILFASIGTVGASLLMTTNNGFIVYMNAEEEQAEAEEKDKELQYFTLDQVAQHNSLQSGVWVIFKGSVYNVTEFIEGHPGGTDKIMLAAGKSIEPFWSIYRQHHTKEVYEILSQYKIGELHPEDAKKLKEQFEQQQKNANDIYSNDPVRNPILVVNMDKPFNAETPPTLLCDKFITPNELFFIRNHLPVPTIDPSTYVLEIVGESLENGSIKLTLDDLKNEKCFKHHTLTVALQCAGNRRTEMSSYKAPRGLGWTNAAVGNATWTGVKLVDILEAYGITEDKILSQDRVKHVEFVGADTDGISTYATSIPVDRALSNKADVLLAFKMNGEDIPIDHGFPIRAIVPGAIGARNVKWLSKIILSESESQSVWQQKDYKTFSPSTDWDTADFSKSSAVHDAPVQSAICVPSPNSKIAPDSETILVKGYALAGSGNGIERVDITTDNGTTWHMANLEREPLKYNRNYGWTLWQVEVPITEKDISDGQVKICSKAVDTAYNVQPEDVKSVWNIRGILNNTWHCVNVSIENENQKISK